MSKSLPPAQPDRVGILAEAIRQARLCWTLFWDGRVPAWTKTVPLATLGYILFPLDLIPDAIPVLGQLDDVAILLLGLRLFVSLIPADVVDQVRRELGFAGPATAGQTVDASYRVVDGQEGPPAGAVTRQDEERR